MSHPPNPFADDARLVAATRAAPQSPDALANPYASPSLTSSKSVAEVVGVWREDDKLLMHRDAQLPPLCIHCGRTSKYEQLWTKAISWKASLKLATPQCHPCSRGRHWANRLRWVSFGGIALLVLFQFYLISRGFTVAALSINFVAVAASLALSRVIIPYIAPLAICHREGPYIWLEGASNAFLIRLPVVDFSSHKGPPK